MRLHFLGANKEVTGSSTLLEVAGKKILIDCGLKQSNGGLKDFSETHNFNLRDFEFDINELDYIIITHSHIDHIGRLGKAINENPNIKVISTEPTALLGSLNIKDCAYLSKKECEKMNKRVKSNKFKPIYSEEDVENIEKYFRCYDYNCEILLHHEEFPFEKVTAILKPSGHMIGASVIYIIHETEFFKKTIVFTGDVSGMSSKIPFTKPCEEFGDVDYIVTESTYGDRKHPDENFKERLIEIMRSTFKKNGIVFMPVFALHKSSTILQMLHEIFMTHEEFKDIPVYLDSPMAIESHKTIQRLSGFWDTKWVDKINGEKSNVWNWSNLKYLHNFQDTRSLDYEKSSVVLSCSGMLSGGRALYTIQRILPKSKNSVVFTGFTPDGTLAHKLINTEQKTVTIDGKKVRIRSSVYQIPKSGHADINELTEWLKTCDKNKIKKVFLVHGGNESIKSFKTHLKNHLNNVIIEAPEYNEKVKLY